MFSGFSLLKRFENVSLGTNDSRVLYTATQDCFVMVTAKQVSGQIGLGAGVVNPGLRGAMIANTHTTRNIINPNISSGLTYGVNNPTCAHFSFLPSGKNFEWISNGFLAWVIDIDILTSGNS